MMNQAQPMMGQPTPQVQTGLSAWMDKETLIFILKVLFVAAIIIFGFWYYTNKSRDRSVKAIKSANKADKDEAETETKD